MRWLKTSTKKELTRRQVLTQLGAGTLFIYTAGRVDGDEEKKGIQKEVLLTSRLLLGADGVVTVLTGKVECGQGIRTTLTQVAAEELGMTAASVRLLMGDTALVPDDGGTWGSLTTPETVPVIRQACAALRELLCRQAAARWQVEPKSLTVVDGSIAGPSSRTYSYRDLANDAALGKAVNVGGRLREQSEWLICGKPLPNVNAPSIVAGSQKYSSDIADEGMLHGRVASSFEPPVSLDFL